MKKLWIMVAALGLVYLAVYGVAKEMSPKESPAQPDAPAAPAAKSPAAQGGLTVLKEKASGDARGRSDSASTLHPDSVKPAYFTADLQKESKKGEPGAVEGYVIVVTTKIDGKPRSKVTYHAAEPDRLVYVSTEVLK